SLIRVHLRKSAANTVFSSMDENQTDRVVYLSRVLPGNSVCPGGRLALARGLAVLHHLPGDVFFNTPLSLFLRSGTPQRTLRLANPTKPKAMGQSPPLT